MVAGFLNNSSQSFENIVAFEKGTSLDFIQSSVKKENINLIQTVIGYHSPLFCLVPKAIFDPEEAHTYIHFISSNDNNGEVIYDWLPDLSSYLVYSIDQKILKDLDKTWPGSKTFHLFSGLIQAQTIHSLRIDKKSFYLNIYDSSFTLTVLEGRSLLFFNSFSFQSEADIVYYTLFSLEQIDCLPHKIELYVSGNIEENDSLWNLLYTYIKKIQPLSLPGNFKYSEEISSNNPFKYYSLFSQFLCA